MLVQPGHVGFSLARTFDSAVMGAASPSSNLSLMARVTGTNFTAGLPDLSGSKITTATSFSGLQSQLNDANGAKHNILEAKGQFETALEGVQRVVYSTIADVAKDQGLNSVAAMASLGPTPNTNIADAAAQIGGDMLMGGTVSTTITTLNTLSAELKNLSDEQRNKLLAEVHARLTPSQDFTGQKKTPQVESDYDFSAVEPKEIEALLLPPENHPEGKAIGDALKHVDEQVIAPLAQHDVVESIADGDTAKNIAALEESGVDITQVLTPEFVAAAAPATAERDAATAAQDHELDAGMIAALSGALPETTGFIQAAAPPVSEAQKIVAATMPQPEPAVPAQKPDAAASNNRPAPPDMPMSERIGNGY